MVFNRIRILYLSLCLSNPSVSYLEDMQTKLSGSKHAGVLVSSPLIEYEAARRFQWSLCENRIADSCPDTLVVLEHQPVMTLGRTTKEAHWKGQTDVFKNRGIQVIACERGGSVTYHGPGQIVGYPILRLRSFCSGPKTYMRMLEEMIIRVLAEWGIEGQRVDKLVGVWAADPQNPIGPLAKIAAMGVKITRGVTMHGFALNATVDLEPFKYIVPCGIEDCRVTSMTELLGSEPDLQLVRDQIADHFAEVFGIEWTERVTEIPHHS